jgi:hypothetical protein
LWHELLPRLVKLCDICQHIWQLINCSHKNQVELYLITSHNRYIKSRFCSGRWKSDHSLSAVMLLSRGVNSRSGDVASSENLPENVAMVVTRPQEPSRHFCHASGCIKNHLDKFLPQQRQDFTALPKHRATVVEQAILSTTTERVFTLHCKQPLPEGEGGCQSKLP